MHHLTILNGTLNGNYPYSKSTNFQNKRIYFNQKYTLRHWDNYIDQQNEREFLVLGRPAIEPDQWKQYDDKSAFITRFLSQQFDSLPIDDFCRSINGSFTLLVLDNKKKRLTLIRDKFGVFPIFIHKKDNINSVQVSTHPDLLADNVQTKRLDQISIAEFLSDGFVSHPYTFYRDISSIHPGHYVQLDFHRNLFVEKQYYSFASNLCFNFDQMRDELADALLKSIKRRTSKYYGSTGVLLSGGGDSRPLAIHSETKPKAFTSFFRKNREFDTAVNIGKRLKLEHVFLQRSSDSMMNGLKDSPSYTGGMATGGSATFLELLNNPEVQSVDNLLTGDYADWLLKDIAFNTAPRKILGQKLPLNNFTKFSNHYYGGCVLLDRLQEAIANRKNILFPSTVRHQTNKLQLKRIIPLSNEYTSSSRLFLQRMFPWESYFIDNDVINSVLKIPPEFKLNGRVLDQALKKLCLEIIDIPHSAKGTRIGTNVYVSAAFMTMSIFKEKYINRHTTHQATWDNTKQLMLENYKLQRCFYDTPKEYQQFVSRILGIDLFSMDIKDIFRIDYHLFYNVISFCSWLKLNKVQT